MKIGYIMQKGVELRHPPYNGPAVHVQHIFHELAKRGHQVQLLMQMDDGLWKSHDLEDFAPIAGVGTGRARPHISERMVRYLQAKLRLPYFAYFDSKHFATACYQELADCDLLYERRNWMCYGGVLAARRLNIPLVLEDNGDSLADLDAKGIAPQGIQRRVSVQVTKWMLQQATHIIASGEGWRTNLIQRWGVKPSSITTIENGTTLMELLPRSQLRAFCPTASPQQPSPLTLVYLGGFYPWHGVPILLRAFARATANGLSAKLYLIGAGDQQAEAKVFVTELGLDQSVVFTGQLGAMAYASVLANADIGLAPYCNWPEYSGLKILDYKAAGLASIVSGQHGLPPTVTHGETGWIVPPCEEDALVAAMQRLAADPTLRQQMGQQARIEAEQSHRWCHTAKRVERLLMSTLAKGDA